jgi:hypothetical protein
VALFTFIGKTFGHLDKLMRRLQQNGFFEAKHADLFESLVANVRIPERPQRQNHDQQKRLIA